MTHADSSLRSQATRFAVSVGRPHRPAGLAAAWDGALSWAQALGALVGSTRERAARVAADLDAAGLEDPDVGTVLREGLDRLDAVVGGDPALPAAYTVLPFATCWCVFDPPPGLTDHLLERFEDGLAAPAERVEETLPALSALFARGTAWARREWGADVVDLPPYPALG